MKLTATWLDVFQLPLCQKSKMAQKLVEILSPVMSELHPIISSHTKDIEYYYDLRSGGSAGGKFHKTGLKSFQILFKTSMKPRTRAIIKRKIVAACDEKKDFMQSPLLARRIDHIEISSNQITLHFNHRIHSTYHHSLFENQLPDLPF